MPLPVRRLFSLVWLRLGWYLQPSLPPPCSLASLDTLLLADETKALAEATFLKKQMYYNMRIKTLRRNARQIVKLAAEGRQVRAKAGGRAGARWVCVWRWGAGARVAHVEPGGAAAFLSRANRLPHP